MAGRSIACKPERFGDRCMEERRQWYRCFNLSENEHVSATDSRRERENTGVIDFWCLYFMLKIGRCIQAVWSMGAVVLRKNLSKCVISPLMEHRRKAILLIPLSLVLLGCFHTPFLPSSSCSLTSPFHYQPSIYQPFPLLKEWLSSSTVLDGVIAVVYLPPCSPRASACVFSHMLPNYFTSKVRTFLGSENILAGSQTFRGLFVWF